MGYIRVGSEPYTGEHGDGLPGIPMRVVFDTGSTNLWVTGDKCQKELTGKYMKEKSPTWHDESNSYQVHIKFGTGQLKGPTVRDTVRIGPFEVKDQIFGVIEEEIGDIFKKLDDFGGIFGL